MLTRLILLCVLLFSWLPNSFASQLGANKADLMVDYFARTIPQPDQSDGYVQIRRLMAEKALADARDAGLSFLRVQVTGYRPVNFGDEQNDLREWQNDPASFWATMDEMFDALDRAHLQLVPVFDRLIDKLGKFTSALLGKVYSALTRD